MTDQPKAAIKLKAPRAAKPVNASPKTAKPKGKPEAAAKPAKAAATLHDIATSWDHPSTVMNVRVSRTAIDLSRFGTLATAPLTDRDRKSLADLREAFQKKAFQRANLDSGILRRLGERGLLTHVSGSNVAADATFQLTARAFAKEAAA